MHLGDVDFADHEGAPTSVRKVLAQSFTDGIVVLHRGAIVMEHYDSGVEPHEPHLLMSVSKSLTSALTSVVCEQGHCLPTIW